MTLRISPPYDYYFFSLHPTDADHYSSPKCSLPTNPKRATDIPSNKIRTTLLVIHCASFEWTPLPVRYWLPRLQYVSHPYPICLHPRRPRSYCTGDHHRIEHLPHMHLHELVSV